MKEERTTRSLIYATLGLAGTRTMKLRVTLSDIAIRVVTIPRLSA